MEPQTAEKTFFITFNSIMNVVCQELPVTPEDILQPDKTKGARQKDRVFARSLCMALSKYYHLGGDEQIGEFFNRDRCSVYAAVNSVNNDIRFDKYRRSVYDAILKKLTTYGRLGLPKANTREPIRIEVSNFEYQDISEEALSFQGPVKN